MYIATCIMIVSQVFEGNRHEVLHDKDQESARELIKDWVLAHLTAPEQSEHTSEPTSSSEIQTTEESTSGLEQMAEGQLDTQQATMVQEPVLSSSSQAVECADT